MLIFCWLRNSVIFQFFFLKKNCLALSWRLHCGSCLLLILIKFHATNFSCSARSPMVFSVLKPEKQFSFIKLFTKILIVKYILSWLFTVKSTLKAPVCDSTISHLAVHLSATHYLLHNIRLICIKYFEKYKTCLPCFFVHLNSQYELLARMTAHMVCESFLAEDVIVHFSKLQFLVDDKE